MADFQKKYADLVALSLKGRDFAQQLAVANESIADLQARERDLTWQLAVVNRLIDENESILCDKDAEIAQLKSCLKFLRGKKVHNNLHYKSENYSRRPTKVNKHPLTPYDAEDEV